MADATKYDGDKVRLELFPFNAMIETSRVLTYGAEVYDAGNWKQGKGFKYSRLIGAMLRHLVAWAMGEEYDPKSGLHHLGHLICEAAFAYETWFAKHGEDDRRQAQLILSGENATSNLSLLMPHEVMEQARSLRADMEARKNGGESVTRKG